MLKCGFLYIFLRYKVIFYIDLRNQLYLTNSTKLYFFFTLTQTCPLKDPRRKKFVC